jgi:dolichol-phosphate mannosyltransferase
MRKEDSYSITLSIVVPVFNEQENIDILVREVEAVLEEIKVGYEIVLVDDGSVDETWKHIKALGQCDQRIKGLRLSRNFGHQHALLAGLDSALGKAVLSMDGDLQHPPILIREMFDKWREGYQIVNTYREDVEVSSLFKRLTSRYFYKFFAFMTDVPMSAGTSDFRLVDRVVIENLVRFKDVDLFLRGAVNWLGFSAITVPYKAAERFSGSSKYTFGKMLRFAKGAIISFSTKPLIIGVWLGLITSLLSFLEIVYVLIQYTRGVTISGWASTLGVLSFLFGILFVILGIIGTYLGRIYSALQGRPRYVLREATNIYDHKD